MLQKLQGMRLFAFSPFEIAVNFALSKASKKHIDTQYCPGLEFDQRDYSCFFLNSNYAETERNVKAPKCALSSLTPY